MEAKPVSKSSVEIAQIMMPENANPAGNVQGGAIMKIIDEAAGITASRHTHQNCVTVSVDRLDFISPVFIGNVVFAKASINFIGKASMEIGVRVEAECLTTGIRTHVGSAYLTFVALDENDKPLEIPKIIPEIDEEKRRFEEAKKRREYRIKIISKYKHPKVPCIPRPAR